MLEVNIVNGYTKKDGLIDWLFDVLRRILSISTMWRQEKGSFGAKDVGITGFIQQWKVSVGISKTYEFFQKWWKPYGRNRMDFRPHRLPPQDRHTQRRRCLLPLGQSIGQSFRNTGVSRWDCVQHLTKIHKRTIRQHYSPDKYKLLYIFKFSVLEKAGERSTLL